MLQYTLSTIRVSILSLFLSISYAEESEFPGRQTFPEVQVITLEELFRQKDDVIIVDVRSEYEYETLRIKGAINIPLARSTFADELFSLSESTNKSIVFYCNGRTCYKSYKAVVKAKYHNIDNCLSFDAGIFDWAKAFPEYAELLGKSPIKPNDLISTKDFHARLLTPEEFGKKIGRKAIVLDVRDRFQREAIGFFPGVEKKVGLDQKDKLNKYFKKAKRERKTLLIYDAVGKQVRWLQYSLKEAGVNSYFFMKGGAKGFYDMLAREQWQ